MVHMLGRRSPQATLDRLLPITHDESVKLPALPKGKREQKEKEERYKMGLTNTSCGGSADTDSSRRSHRGPTTAWNHNGNGVSGPRAILFRQLRGAGRVVCVALADGRGAVARVGEVGGDVGEGEEDVRHVGGSRGLGRTGGYEAFGSGAGADGAGRERGRRDMLARRVHATIGWVWLCRLT